MGAHAFFYGTQVVIDHRCDNLEVGGGDPVHDHVDAGQYELAETFRRCLHVQCENTDEGKCEDQDLPAMTPGQLGAATHGGERPDVLDHAGGQRDGPARRQDDPGDDEEDQADEDPQADQDRHAENRPEARKAAPDRVADNDGAATHGLKRAVENNRLADELQDHGDDRRNKSLRHAKGGLGIAPKLVRQHYDDRHQRECEKIGRVDRPGPAEDRSDSKLPAGRCRCAGQSEPLNGR